MLTIKTVHDSIAIGERFAVSFQRTLRLPEDDRVYPLPPGLGRFPITRAADYPKRMPEEWVKRGDLVIPMYQREALWLSFDAAEWKPNAVQIGVGAVNAVSGEAWEAGLSDAPQNYFVCPDQLWLDGINAGAGIIRQFVAMPLGSGTTVEAQVTGQEREGGIQIRVYEPKPGRFPDKPPPRPALRERELYAAAPAAMGLGAGGRMEQKFVEDEYGLDTWDTDNFATVFVHIVDSAQFQNMTGLEPPSTPVDAAAYTRAGFPWFSLYEESRRDVAAPAILADVKPIRQIEGDTQDEESIPIPDTQVYPLHP